MSPTYIILTQKYVIKKSPISIHTEQGKISLHNKGKLRLCKTGSFGVNSEIASACEQLNECLFSQLHVRNMVISR